MCHAKHSHKFTFGLHLHRLIIGSPFTITNGVEESLPKCMVGSLLQNSSSTCFFLPLFAEIGHNLLQNSSSTCFFLPLFAEIGHNLACRVTQWSWQ
jgi:hypothetical protein